MSATKRVIVTCDIYFLLWSRNNKMPLVIMCGFPASGKSKRANELLDILKSNSERNVHVVGDHSVGVIRNEVYADSKKEKDVRSSLKSSTQRLLNKEDVVILDSLNYIKGFRYELYCVTKACHTPHCVLFCDISKEKAMVWNQSREESDQYTPDIFEGLVMRFEAPTPSNRWDSPLFVIQPEDELPHEAINDALFKRKPPPPNQSTLVQPLSSTNFLYELDKCTQETINTIMEAQKTSVPGDEVVVPGAKDKIALLRPFTLAELHRHRRQFITYSKMHPQEDTSKVTSMFVQYLNNSLR